MSLRVVLVFPFVTAELLIHHELLQRQVGVAFSSAATAILVGICLLGSVFIPTERAPEIYAAGTAGVRPKSRFVWSVRTLLLFMALAATTLSVCFTDWRAWRLKQAFDISRATTGAAVFSPDGSRFALPGDTGGVWLYDVKPGTPVTKIGVQQEPPFAMRYDKPFVFSRDGTRLLVCEQVASDGRPGPSLHVYDLTTGIEIAQTKTGDTKWIEAACFPAEESNRVLFIAGDEVVYEMLVADGSLLRRCQLPDASNYRFSPSGAYVVLQTSALSGEIEVWDSGRGEFVCQIQCGELSGSDHVVALNEQRVTIVNDDGVMTQYDLKSGERLADVFQADWADWPVAISPDGSRIMAGDVIYDAGSGRDLQQLFPNRPSRWLRSVTFSPDGMHVVLITRQSRAELWHRVRPELWWVGLWDPRFWGVNVLLALFMLSWNRDEYRREQAWIKQLGDGGSSVLG
jgi:hypothetical protein